MKNNTFTISDHHFGHENIIDYTKRPFDSVEEMNTYMIKQWNKVVAPGDTLYHLGDFSIGVKEDEMKELVNKLNGNIILIRGNHDRYGTKKLLGFGFKEVVNKRKELDNFILSHEPLDPYKLNGKINIHGHIHNNSMKSSDKYFNVSVEQLDYTPILLSTIKERMI